MNNANKNYNKVLLTYSVFIIVFVLDQLTKNYIINTMPIEVFIDTSKFTSYPSQQIFSWLWLTHVVNFGAAWSLFSGQKYLLLAFGLIVYSALVYYEFNSRNTRTKTLSIGLGFILAGLGNFVDRIRLGYVTDFLDVRNSLGQNVWPIFNVADISIDIGVFLFIIYVIFQEGKNKASNQDKYISE